MKQSLNIAICQLNFTVGDIYENCNKIKHSYDKSKDDGADLVIFSELAVTGYPPEDLVLRKSFKEHAEQATKDLAALTVDGPDIIVGNLHNEEDGLYNAAIHLSGGKIASIIKKHKLPNYGVFDEKRIFSAATDNSKPVEIKGHKFGIIICEDMWHIDSAKKLKQLGSEAIIVINASPFEIEKHEKRLTIAKDNVKHTGIPLIYVNQVGGQDELVFEGGSFILSNTGELLTNLPFWQEKVVITKWNQKLECQKGLIAKNQDNNEATYNAMVMGLRDYVTKNRFNGVIIGMSGGIDSALTAAIAVDALVKDKVMLVMMPSIYTSEESLVDAKECAKNLGCRYEIIEIKSIVSAYDTSLQNIFAGAAKDITEENIQSRTRANILMALSNKFGFMVVTTGNKSEMAVGYATLYGDMCGGFNVLKDIYKTKLYALANWLNARSGNIIPKNIIDKPPTAELKFDQKDQDTLPPYEILDDILYRFIELEQSSEEIVKAGHNSNDVTRVLNLIFNSEYKRRQAPPGVKLSNLAFGKERRYPITNNHHGWK